MTRGGRRTVAVCALAALAALAPRALDARALARPGVLASYSFDDDVATGPDTFAVWQGGRHARSGKGHVALSSGFHVSGHRSVELADVPGDSDFPELQGYFPARRSGRVYFHFAFLTTDPQQELNIALAGPRSFELEPDGIAFWLGTRDGRLVHYSDSIPKRLFVPDAFVWYTVDVAYDIDRGRYDLEVRAEGQPEPLVSLRGQPNAVDGPGSAIDKFSFVGAPFSDASSVVYYVDDVVVASDQSAARVPFVAPGRRRLFIDLFVEYEGLLREKPRCLPATAPEDLGLDAEDVRALVAAGSGPALESLLSTPGVKLEALPAEQGPEHWQRTLAAAAAWSEGCAALERGDARAALTRFLGAAETAPGGGLYPLSTALALAALGRIDEADQQLTLASDLRHDARYAVAMAYVGLARRDLDRALDWLREPAARALDRDAQPPGAEPVETLVSEQYYYVALWKQALDDARDYALRMAERARRAGLAGAAWSVRAADACFYQHDTAAARELYESALQEERDWGALRGIYLRLADLAYLAGDLPREQRLREHYYGALR